MAIFHFSCCTTKGAFRLTATPAKSIGAYPNIGSLQVGAKADVLIVSKDMELEKVL